MSSNEEPFRIKRGDTLPPLEVTLGKPVPDEPETLEGATVRFVLRQEGASDPAVTGAAEVVDAVARIVRYRWQSTDTQRAGHYLAEFEVSYPDGRIKTYPTGHRLIVVVEPDLG